MALDLERMRAKLNSITGKDRAKNDFWRPEDGENNIRIVPTPDGDPFKEFHFHYNVGQGGFLCPKRNFGDDCPVCNFANKLWNDGTEESKKQAKDLFAKQRFFSPVLVRGQESESVKVWGFGKMAYEKLLTIVLDPDYGDITDPSEGRDVKVSCNKPPGRMWAMTEVRPRGKGTPLSSDTNQAADWVRNIPDLDEMFTLKTYAELEKIVNDWLNGDTEESSSEGTFRGGNSKPTETTTSNQSDTTKYKSLDDAFADLEDL